MRWLSFGILAGMALVLQAVLGPHLQVAGARPDWLLIVVVFCALYAAELDAVAAAWIVGACADLMTIERPGLLSLSYTVAALLVVAVREYLFRYRAATQFVVTLFAGLAVRTAWMLYRRTVYETTAALSADFSVTVLMASAYTALWAPPAHAGLLRAARLLGVARGRYAGAGLRSLRHADV